MYFTSRIPETKKKIFRDFPDVLSDEYKENAKNNAKALAARKDDPMMIGYFLRNEPSWAFVDNLVLADEVLYNPERTVCKEKLIAALKEKYQTVEALNTAWNTKFNDFDDLYQPIRDASAKSEAAKEDQKTFSKEMLRAYVEIPSKACREVDPNHMILGMRWAWISDPDLATGWENFDVFSINCYAVDPTEAISHVVELGVDGEDVGFHLRGRDVLELERLDGVGEEAAGGLEHGVGVADEIDELRIGEHLHQFAHTARVGRILTEELRAARVPQRDLDKLHKRFFEHAKLLGRDVVEEQILVGILLHVAREEPEVVVRVGHHVSQGELLLLRQVDSQFHVVCRTFVGHEPAHVFLEEGLSPHHQVREDGLIGRIVAEVAVTGEDIVHECRPRCASVRG